MKIKKRERRMRKDRSDSNGGGRLTEEGEDQDKFYYLLCFNGV